MIVSAGAHTPPITTEPSCYRPLSSDRVSHTVYACVGLLHCLFRLKHGSHEIFTLRSETIKVYHVFTQMVSEM